ncbi:MAG: glycosyltransferase family 2 protein [Acidobacteriia bacterium]|nr:glycosyltransferase family 2 protein [Terriglobia bacterium]
MAAAPRPHISLILPAFNEAATIARTVGEAAAYFTRRGWIYQIIVAADGEDDTRAIAARIALENPAVAVTGNRERLGKGRGVRTAMAHATGDIVGFADADNKVPIQEFDKFQAKFAGGFDIAIGSRALDPSMVRQPQPWYRRIGSRGFAIALHAILGLAEFPDTQCGFKFFRREIAERIFRLQKIDGYMFDIEILALAQKMGLRVAQIPVEWRDDRDSRLELVRGNMQNLRDVFRIRRAMRSIDVAEFAGTERGRATYS